MRIDLDGRTFTVTFDSVGKVVNIYERKIYAPGRPWQAYYNAVFYNAATYKDVRRIRPNSLLRRLLDVAERRFVIQRGGG